MTAPVLLVEDVVELRSVRSVRSVVWQALRLRGGTTAVATADEHHPASGWS